MMRHLGCLAVLLLAGSARADDQHFEKSVRPLLIERCHKCHAGSEAKGGLRLDSREAALQGGETGAAVVAGKPEQSLLLQAVRHENGLEMPPDGKLTAAQIEALAKWVREGAVWPGAPVAPPAEKAEADATTT
ncbi:MAG: c-type cytochrome domain-containing protein, partial [Planctomycetaceae bacterium]